MNTPSGLKGSKWTLGNLISHTQYGLISSVNVNNDVGIDFTVVDIKTVSKGLQSVLP